MEDKTKELTRLLCKWNREKLTADELAHAIWVLYKKEALETWNDPLEKLLTENP